MPAVSNRYSMLKSCGLRATPQRLRIIEYLESANGHPSAEEIFGAVSPAMPSLSRATVYNVLSALISAGLAQEVDIIEKEARYDCIMRPHGHFLCLKCGKIRDFEADFGALSTEGLGNSRIEVRNLYFKGKCENCIREENYEGGEKDEARR